MPQQFTIKKLTGLCSIQDLGRFTAQHLGFSAGGASDEYAFLSANTLLNNPNNSAALEISFAHLTLQIETTCTIAITGADCQTQLNGQAIKHWQVHHLNAGDILELFAPKSGLHSYLAIYNGINSAVWLGSRSVTLTEQALDFSSKQLTNGDTIPLHTICHNPQIAFAPAIKQHFYQTGLLTLRFIPHALWHDITVEQQQAFRNMTYTISAHSNRMGYKLTTKVTPIPLNLTTNKKTNLSKPITYGAIQLPSNNLPIILMKERQTIGGYPTLGTVIHSDLSRLSQKRPGEKVCFIPISLAQAQQQYLSFYRRFNDKTHKISVK